MGFIDKAKDFAAQSSAKARDLAREHSDKIDQGIQRAGTFVDDKTGGKYADKIDKAQDFATKQADKLAGEDGTPGHDTLGEDTPPQS